MEFRTSARDKELALGFHKLTATDSAQAAQPLRRLTQATAETVYRTADPYAVAGWDQGSGDDYSDRASDQMRSGAPRYSGQERAAARPTYRTASTYDYGIGAPATPHGEGLTPSGQPFPDPAETTATAANANGAASSVRGGSATTNTGGATTGDGEALVHEDPVTLIRRGTPLDPDGPLHQPSRLPEREGLLLEDLDGP
ncbi:hypothetical protein, partial [Corynebacterium variabile]|uniref:hypothetical protein n=1 Tax=Corynebacterium variabile TaxID=1727 RepID=UPI002FE3BAE8